ncbi:aldehyde dehydrogenase family protein [Luteithermobacter gelatinilyticus]|uniref:aldehyde dehydrogenase family protein n=1 Tax=Luteithermobacter gelatinilyticus TaxID=2582913 RepID=UPI0011074A72|nr:aldehyde dehydrogenase family protein [Luteithermobacter gelatinilyticus]|tara:strand:- start:2782 stop:4290 length:1509 start_codon:yes stop_codon:yes gene_type:complete
MTAQSAQISKLGAAARRFVSQTRNLLINGEHVPARSGKTFETFDPADNGVICAVAEAGAEDIDLAVQAARRQFDGGEWSKLRPSERERLILRLADLVEQHADELAELEAIDNGKLLPYARFGDVSMAVDFLRYMAGWATKIEGRTIHPSVPYVQEARFWSYTLKEPVGVVGQIIPWNFPLVMAAWKIGPALATGCTVVLKPAEQTPLTALRLGELCLEAGIPAGVVNVVPGFGHTAGVAMVEHPGIDKIAFTGSTETGKAIGRAAVDTMKRVSLELGGKSPMIVMADADMDVAIPGAAMGIFFNQGQVCTAGSRLYVQRSVFDKVTEGIAEIAKSFKLGPAFAEDAQLGPLVSKAQQERVGSYIQSGLDQGAVALSGGRVVEGQGCFVEPTVFVNANRDMKIVQEEIFGPVIVAQPIDDLDDIAAVANDTIYGLGASIWTTNLNTAHGLAAKIRAGSVWINSHNIVDPAVPFGGFKQSGYGREMGQEVIDLYTETKAVTMMV